MLERVLYKDGMLLVLDKPAGLAVHAGAGKGPHLGKYLAELSFGKTRQPELAHRLDRDTSGCLALGRHPKALRALAELFQAGKVEKVYWAWVEGAPPQPDGEVEASLEQIPGAEIRMRVSDSGQTARTLFRTLESKEGRTLLELRPQTGRTHQLRVHCAHIGCPIVGDARYGKGGKNMLLHSRSLTVPLYPKREAIHVEAPVPEYWP